MRGPLFMPLVALSTLSTIVSLIVLACAAQALRTFNLDQSTDVWLLPIWRDHFDIRDIQTLVGAGSFITFASILVLVSTLVSRTPKTALDLGLSSLSTIAALLALILSNVFAKQNSDKDTLQSWTCGWLSNDAAGEQGLSSSFTTTCRTTRTAFWAMIPLLILQLTIFVCVAASPMLRGRSASRHGGPVEKGYSMDAYQRSPSWDSSDNQKPAAIETVHPARA